MGAAGTWKYWLATASAGQGLLLFGETIRPLVAPAAVWATARGAKVLVVDAVGAFDPYHLAREARFRGLVPAKALDQVRVARAFTCHQLVRLVRESLPAELAAIPSPEGGTPPALLLLLGPCSLFYDEQVPLAERRQLFQTLVHGLAQLKPRATIWLLQPCLPQVIPNRHFGRGLAPLVDTILELCWGRGGPYLQPRPPLSHRAGSYTSFSARGNQPKTDNRKRY